MGPKFEKSGKILLLRRVLENKRLLFGKFDASKGVTKESRREVWSVIHRELSSLGYPVGQNGDYVRDTTFANIRKRTTVSVTIASGKWLD